MLNPRKLFWKLSKALNELYLQNPQYWLKKLHFVTGADSSHFQSSLNFLESVRDHEPTSSVTYWDLGLSETEVSDIRKKFPEADLRKFEFSLYPSHMNIQNNAGWYAWKPVVVALAADQLQELGESNRLLVWADAGDIVLRRLTRLRGLVGRLGLYTPKSPGKLKTWTHPQTLRILEVDQHLWNTQNCNAALVAFDLSAEKTKEILGQWVSYAYQKECIAPKGSSRRDHRQDQAILSCIVAKGNFIPDSAFMHAESIGVAVHQDVE